MFDFPGFSKLAALLLATLTLAASPATHAGDALRALLAKADAPRLDLQSGTLEARLTVRNQGRPGLVSLLTIEMGDRDERLILFREGKHRGRKVLQKEGRTWLIVPGSAHPIPVSAQQQALTGAPLGEFAHLSLAEDFTAESRGAEACDEGTPDACQTYTLSARTNRDAPMTYTSGRLWVDPAGRARRLRLALASGKPAQEITFTYQSGRLRRMQMRDLLDEVRGQTVILDYLDHRPGDFPEGHFEPGRFEPGRSEPDHAEAS